MGAFSRPRLPTLPINRPFGKIIKKKKIGQNKNKKKKGIHCPLCCALFPVLVPRAWFFPLLSLFCYRLKGERANIVKGKTRCIQRVRERDSESVGFGSCFWDGITFVNLLLSLNFMMKSLITLNIILISPHFFLSCWVYVSDFLLLVIRIRGWMWSSIPPLAYFNPISITQSPLFWSYHLVTVNIYVHSSLSAYFNLILITLSCLIIFIYTSQLIYVFIHPLLITLI